MRARTLKPLEEKIKLLEDGIVACEARAADLNDQLMRDSAKGGLGAIRRSAISRELKEHMEKAESLYAELDSTMKIYNIEKLKYSG